MGKARQLFPGSEDGMTARFPMALCRKHPAVKCAKLRRSPDPARNSWRASNVLCRHRQMDRSVTYTCNPRSVGKITYERPPSYLTESVEAFSAPPLHKHREHARPQPPADWPLAGSVLCRGRERSSIAAPAGQHTVPMIYEYSLSSRSAPGQKTSF